jgi:transcriptional regulator with XRE-family HTH domain
MKSFKERLVELKQKYDLDQKELAKRKHVSRAAISRYESGEIQPTLKVMIKIKECFGVSLDWLAGYDIEERTQYTQIINECESTGIEPEKLHQLINVLKK